MKTNQQIAQQLMGDIKSTGDIDQVHHPVFFFGEDSDYLSKGWRIGGNRVVVVDHNRENPEVRTTHQQLRHERNLKYKGL